MSATIRYRKTQKGYSVYLDVYHRGKRTYEYPEIIVSKDYTGLSNYLKQDREKILLAEKIRDKINLSIAEGKYNFVPSYLKNIDCVSYFEKIANEKKHHSYFHALNKFREFAGGGKISFSELTETKIQEYIKFLTRTGINENTAHHYTKLLNIVINRAVCEKIITENPIKFIPKELKPKRQQPQREYLTIDELRALKKTPFHSTPQIAQAFLFGCFTGLRISDIKKLKHSEIVDGQIQYRQKKSKEQFQYLPLNETAKEILTQVPPPQHSDLVFWDLPNSNSHSGYQLKIWGAKAGIKKNPTWHTARHTFAVLFLSNGGDIYTLKELLGHSSVAITEIYAKVVPTKKQELVNNIPAL